MNKEEIKKMYETNEDFADYVASFARDKQITIEEAMEYHVIRDVAEYYKNK